MVTLEQHISRQKLSSYLGGDSSTPFGLVQEMVDKIPLEVIKNPNSKFLDPAAGVGTFVIILFYELKKYHSEEHILNNMLYVCEVNRFKVRILKNLGIKNIYGGSFLEQDFKGMKFDVIIGNPPYQTPGMKSNHKKYWIEFLLKGRSLLNNNSYLCFVTPSSYINTSRHGKHTLGEGTSNYNLSYYKDLGAYFKGIGIDVCFYVEQNTPYQGKTDYNGVITDLKEGIPLTGDKAIIQSIVDKVIKSNFPKHSLVFNWFDKTELNSDNEGTEVLISAYKTGWLNKELPHSGKLKLVLPFSSSYKKQFITSNQVGHLNNYILLEDEQHGKNIMSYTLSKLFTLVANNFMKSSGFTPFARNKNIPLLDNKHWTESELYSLFNLTQEEIDFVEKNHK